MDALQKVIKKHWGHGTLRPLQAEAMAAPIDGRDSLVVLPTGGGKSLCYQAPALLSDRLTIVVSPLIALMKDQVDTLIQRDIKAAFINSTLDPDDKRRIVHGIYNNEYKMIFVAPERFAYEPFLTLLDQANVGAFAIDEAHCISHWGHDFRGDYRQMGLLKKRFPDATVNAFTATATPRVRADIIEQLGLTDPVELVGDFFRPNLTYRVKPRKGRTEPIIDAVTQRKGEGGIVYCIRRKDVEEIAIALQDEGISAMGYHAGMSDDERTRVQDAFTGGETDVIVATVAFGMGIDRSDIRFVIHAAMPKSIEHYQQETGRAGRDGEPAECLMLYNGGDFHTWNMIIENGENEDTQDAKRLLSEMYTYCTSVSCRHQKLVTYFGQQWSHTKCCACDVCLDEMKTLDDADEIAQKILSCIVRTEERFGGAYIADILTGEATDKVIERGHGSLSTFGLLAGRNKRAVMGWIDQLETQQAIVRDGEYRVLKLTGTGWNIMQGRDNVSLFDVAISGSAARKPRRGKTTRKAVTRVSAGPLDIESKALYQELRTLRKSIAEELMVPAFVVFSDKTLRDIARHRPNSEADFLSIKGVGPAKWSKFGYQFLQALRNA